MDRVPVKIDWSNLRHDPELDKLLTPPKPLGVKFAREFERAIFEYMWAAHVDKIYIWDEYHNDETTIRLDFCFGAMRPEGKACIEHDYSNLVQMTDEEFAKLCTSLPKSPNEDIVRLWRKEMKNDT